MEKGTHLQYFLREGILESNKVEENIDVQQGDSAEGTMASSGPSECDFLITQYSKQLRNIKLSYNTIKIA